MPPTTTNSRCRATKPRNRLTVVVALLVVIAIGLASRKYGDSLPAWISDNAGDALWTIAVFLATALLFPRWSSLRLGIVALLTSWLVETSQLIDVDWLNSFRKTTIGHLFLGQGFLWSDWLRYTIGAVAITGLDWWWLVMTNRQQEDNAPGS